MVVFPRHGNHGVGVVKLAVAHQRLHDPRHGLPPAALQNLLLFLCKLHCFPPHLIAMATS